MKITRLVELSLFYKIREAFSIKKTGERVTSADFSTYNLKYNSIDINKPVVVYVDNAVSNSHSVDYNNGSIRFNPPQSPSNKVTVDYYYCPINIYDEGTSPASNDFKYPAISIYENSSDPEPIELGSNKKEIHARWIIEVWAERGGERNDIKDTLIELFEEDLEIVDYNIAFPTGRNGELDSSYDKQSQVIGYATVDSINSTNGGSLDIGEKPKFLSEIEVELVINL